MTSIFLSHNSQDKPFVRRLARDLDVHGVKCWIDEAEIKVGDSLIEKIRQGLDSMSYVAVVLSPDSVNSAWVQKEIDVAKAALKAVAALGKTAELWRSCSSTTEVPLSGCIGLSAG